MIRLLGILIITGLLATSDAVRVRLKTGQVVPGELIRLHNEERLFLLSRGFSFNIPKTEIEKEEPGESEPDDDTWVTPGLSWKGALRTLEVQEWVKDAWQVPARPLTAGPFKEVPYVSHNLGNAIFNAYGNPAQCCGFEFVLSGESAGNEELRRFCQAALAKMRPTKAWPGKVKWISTIESLNLNGDRKQAKGAPAPSQRPNNEEEIVAEVSLAKGVWRIAAYNLDLLERSRCTKKELEQLTRTPKQLDTEEQAAVKAVANLAPDDPRFVPELAYLWRAKDLPPGADRFFVRGYERTDKGYQRVAFVPIRR